MKQTILISLIFCSFYSFGQSSRSELANSKLYIRATYFDNQNEFIGLETREILSDTLIGNSNFKKIKTADFTDYSKEKTFTTYYESFDTNKYTLLDNQSRPIHQIDYKTDKEQTGLIFGERAKIKLEFIDTRSSYPRDSLIPTDKTPRKYYRADNPEIYLIIVPDLKTLAVSSNGKFYTKQLFGDNYNQISEGLENNYSISNKPKLQIGDEIQLFYRRKWYNDTTNLAEFEDKQFKNFKYLGDTTVNNERAFRIQVEGYSFLSGSYEHPEEFLIPVSDSGYTINGQFIPFQNYKTELKITDNNGQKDFFLQGVTYETIGDDKYPIIIQATSGPYRYYILPFFPMPFIEFGNVQGIITYSKINGLVKGEKRERTYKTDENNIRDITNPRKGEVEIEIYFIEDADLKANIYNYQTNEVLGEIKKKVHKGINTFTIKSKKLTKGEQYGIQIEYEGKNGFGSFSNGVTVKY